MKAEIRPTFFGEGVDTSKTENASGKEFFVEKLKNISRPAAELTEKHKNKPVREIKEIQVSDADDLYEENRIARSQTAINTDSEIQTDAEIREADEDFITAVFPTALQPEAAQTENKSETKKEAETQTKESEEIIANKQKKPVEIQIKNEQIAESPVDGKKITFNEQTTAPGEIECQTPATVKEAKIEITPANERALENQFENAESSTDSLPIEDKNISTEIPISRTIEAEPEAGSITAETEEISFTAQMNSDYSNDYSSDDFYRSEQERIAAENIAEQNRQFQITLEQNNKQSQVQQENYQEAIDAITRNFKQLDDFSRQNYEELDFQEEDAFDNLRQITDTDSTQKTQNQTIMDDEEIQSRLRRASGTDAPPVSSSNIDQELSASQQSEQAEDFQQEASDEEEYSEDEDFEDEPEMERGRSWTLEM